MTVVKNRNRRVFALGETVLDLVSEGGSGMHAIPGGSVLNASVSLGRMEVDVYLISEFGDDRAGSLIKDFLNLNHVSTEFCIRHVHNKTSLALAFLDSDKNATYSFYHDSPENLEYKNISEFMKEDVLLFGSFYSVKPDRRSFVTRLIEKASEAGAVIYYDLNVRKAHSDNIAELIPSFLMNMDSSNIVKGSDEDFLILFGTREPERIYEKVANFCKFLIITNGAEPVQIFTGKHSRSYRIPTINPVSTIGAGDNFNAGFIYGLLSSGINTDTIGDITDSELDSMVGCGLAFATETCLSNGNYISGSFEPDFWKRYF